MRAIPEAERLGDVSCIGAMQVDVTFSSFLSVLSPFDRLSTH